MQNKLKNLIDKIDGEDIKGKIDLKATKSVRLLKEIFSNLKDSEIRDSKHFDKVELLLNDVLNKKFDNLDNVKKDIVNIVELLKESLDKDNQDEIVKKIDELVKKEFPKKIEVSNFPEPKTEIKVNNFPKQKEYPTEIKVNNFPKQKEYPKEIKVNNLPEQKEFPKEIDVNRIKEEVNIKQPKWYKKFDITPFWDKLVTLLTNLSKGEFKVKAKEHEKADNALAVKIVDDKGKFIKDLIPKIHLSSSGGGTADPIGLKNSGGVQINPATSDNQTNGTQRTKITDGTNNIAFANVPFTGATLRSMPVVSALYGYDRTNFNPVQIDSLLRGNLYTTLRDNNIAANIELDTAKNALYVQSETLATETKQDDIIAGIPIPEHKTYFLYGNTTAATDDLTPASGKRLRIYGFYGAYTVNAAFNPSAAGSLSFGTGGLSVRAKVLGASGDIAGAGTLIFTMTPMNRLGEVDEIIRFTMATFDAGVGSGNFVILYNEE